MPNNVAFNIISTLSNSCKCNLVQVLNNQFMASLSYKSFCDLRTSRIPIFPALSEGLNATWVVCNQATPWDSKEK